MDKLSELSKPVAYLVARHVGVKGIGNGRRIVDGEKYNPLSDDYWLPGGREKHTVTNLYSQEYVSAMEQKIAELEQAIRHIHGALLDITVPRVAIAKAAELAAEHAAMKEQSNG